MWSQVSSEVSRLVVGMGLGKVVFRALPRSEVQSLQDGDLCCLAGARALEAVAGNF